MDKRWQQLAEILVNYSTAIQPGERVMIAMIEAETLPLVLAVYEHAIRAGAYVQVQFLSEQMNHALLRYGTADQIAWVPEIEAHGMEWADVYIGLRGAPNPYELAEIPADVFAQHRRVQGVISSMRWNRTRWCLVRVPNAAFAQQAGTDTETMMDMFFDGALLDWQRESVRWHQLAQELGRGRQVQVQGRNTDLQFSVAGRKWIVCDGRINMPDGEIMTAPIESTLHGYIQFEWPAVLSGRLIHDVRLEWDHGRLVSATANENQAILQHVISTDAGASLLGEFAFGTNHAINRFCKDILIDEKIGGTIHVALGRAYPESGGTNVSAIHWDIVKDFRTEGIVLLDGRKIFENGSFLI